MKVVYRFAVIGLFLASIFNCHAETISADPSPLVLNSDVSMDVENVEKDVAFNVFVWRFQNKGEETFKGSVALALVSESGEIKQLVHTETVDSLAPSKYLRPQFVNLKISETDIADTDILRFFTLADGEEAWSPVAASAEYYTNFCNAKGNIVTKIPVNINVIGKYDIEYEGHCDGTSGESYQSEAILYADYIIDIKWPEGKDRHDVSFKSWMEALSAQVDSTSILFTAIQRTSGFTINLMACADDDLLTRSYPVDVPGTLSQLIDNDERIYINNISVSGNINGDDIYFMRDSLTILEYVDLSKAEISEGYFPDYAFQEKGILSIILPETISALGEYSLSETKISQIDIPAGVKFYGDCVFYYCENLACVVLRNPEVISLSDCNLPFEGTKMASGSLFVPQGTKEAFSADSEWGQFAFIIEGDDVSSFASTDDGTYSYCGVYPDVYVSGVVKVAEKMVIPETVVLNGKTFNVTGIAEYVFDYSSPYKEIYIPKSVVKIYVTSIDCYYLEKIEVDEENPVYFSYDGALYDRSTSSLIRYPEGKKDTEYAIPEGITTVEEYSFYSSYLNKITLPSTLEAIKEYGFGGAFRKNEPVIVSNAETPPSIGWSGFAEYTNNNAILYVPAGSLAAYKEDAEWSKFVDIRPIEVTSGIDAVDSENVDIYVNGNTLEVNASVKVEVYNISGRTIYKGTGCNLELPSGIYIIKVGGVVKKIRI